MFDFLIHEIVTCAVRKHADQCGTEAGIKASKTIFPVYLVESKADAGVRLFIYSQSVL